jgi:hypothetical protein
MRLRVKPAMPLPHLTLLGQPLPELPDLAGYLTILIRDKYRFGKFGLKLKLAYYINRIFAFGIFPVRHKIVRR